MKAIWNDTVLAESDDIVTVEGNAYFPADAVNADYLVHSNHRTHCSWKGEATYRSLLVRGDLNADAVWMYADPLPAAADIQGRMAFWKGVQIVD